MEKRDDRPSENEDSKRSRPVLQLLDWLKTLPPGGKLRMVEKPGRKQKGERDE